MLLYYSKLISLNHIKRNIYIHFIIELIINLKNLSKNFYENYQYFVIMKSYHHLFNFDNKNIENLK